MKQSNKKLPILIAAILAATTLFVVLGLDRPNENINTVPEGVDVGDSGYVNVVRGEELLRALGSMEAYEQLRADLVAFGRTAYRAYQSDSKPVGFQIKELVVSENMVEVTGSFGSSTNKISIAIEKLRNNRIKTSITDTVTGLNIDSFLPSNKNINQFIGSLPIHTDEYSISFVSPDIIDILLHESSLSIYEKAYAFIAEQVSKEDLERLHISTTFPMLNQSNL